MASNPFDSAYSEYKKTNPKFKSTTKSRLKSGSVVKSTVKGVNQVAIKGKPSENAEIIETKTVENSQPLTSTKETSSKISQTPTPSVATPNPPFTKFVKQPINYSPTQSLRSNQPYYYSYKNQTTNNYNEIRASKPIYSPSTGLAIAADVAAQRSEQTNNPVKKQSYAFLSVGYKGLSVFFKPFVEPVSFVKESASGIKYVFTTPISESFTGIGEGLRLRPSLVVGEFVGGYGQTKIPGLVKDAYIVTGSKYVEAEKVFDVGTLRGETKFPLASSVEQSVKEFNTPVNNEIVVQTSSPSKLSGNVADVGKKASLGLEDPGIYVTPKGRGSPVFTGVMKDSVSSYDVSFNPFKNAFGVPSVTEFKIKSVVQYPRNVINKPGFESVASYQQDVLAGKQVAVITKRSEIGLGNIKPKEFVVEKTFSIEGSDNLIKKNTIIKEFGTSEIEAVVPLGQKYVYTPKTLSGKIKGFDEYTILEGKPVAIRRAELVGESASVSRGSIVVKESTIKSGGESISSIGTSYRGKGFSSALISSVKSNSSNISTKKSSNYSSLIGSSSSVVSSKSSVVGSSSSVVSSKPNVISSVSYGKSSVVSSKPIIISSSVSGGSGKSESIVRISGSSSISKPGYSSGGSSYSGDGDIKTPNNFYTNRFSSSDGKLFNVEVRRKGVFRSVGRGLSLKDAAKLGVSRVRNTAAASFRVTSQGSPIKLSEPLGGSFYVKGGVVIEKPKYRIKTPGELSEITYQGIRASKIKARGVRI